jgi:eukaryotic-like serine/threonine-protein kinase
VADDALVGTLFGGRWLIERPLVSGGMGSVYVAKHTDTGRAVALKVIKSEVIHEAELTARFRRETAALASLSHPNVVTFLDSGIENGNVYLVMELLAGRSLRDAMFEGPIPHARAFKIGADMCRALAAVHKSGLIHRDLKPENVFLQDAEGHDEIVKLIDFGIVRLESSHATASTKTGAVVGTPGYISPEQLRGQPATPASDIYAVGVILYEMVTGRSPFDAPDVHAMLVRQLIDPVVPPRELNTSLPAHVDAAILRLMERDASVRVQAARDALALLMGDSATSTPMKGLQAGPAQVEGALPPIAGSALSKDTRSTPLGRAIDVPSPASASSARRSRAPLIAAAVVAAASLSAVAVFVSMRSNVVRNDETRSANVAPPASAPPIESPPIESPPIESPPIESPSIESPPIDAKPKPPSEVAASSKRAPEKLKANEANAEAKVLTPPPLPLPSPVLPDEKNPKARSRVLTLEEEKTAEADTATPAADDRVRDIAAIAAGEKVILTMPGAIVTGSGSVRGLFVVTRSRIAFDAATLSESFDFNEVLIVEPLVTQSKRAKLILRDRNGRLSSRILILDDRHTFLAKVNPRARAH